MDRTPRPAPACPRRTWWRRRSRRDRLRLREPQRFLHPDEIGPHLGHRLATTPQHRRRMERGDEHAVAERVAPPPQLGDPLLRLQEELGREVPEGDDDLGVDEVELRLEPRAARLDLRRERIAVPGWS